VKELLKWAARWLGIYLVSNIITVFAIGIAFFMFATHEMTDSQLVNIGKRKAIEDYKRDYITKIANDPNIVSCEVFRDTGHDETAWVRCSVFDYGKIVLDRSYIYTVRGYDAGGVAGFEDHPISKLETE
jgi:hypothetical protein